MNTVFVSLPDLAGAEDVLRLAPVAAAFSPDDAKQAYRQPLGRRRGSAVSGDTPGGT